MSKKKKKAKSFAYTVVDKATVKRIKREKLSLKDRAKRFVTVGKHDRAVGAYLSDPSRKAVLFQKMETVAKIADVTGVTAADRKHAERVIRLLSDTFIHTS